MLTDLRGVIPPIATPFDARGDVVHSALAECVEFQIAAGVHGLIPGGSTGEGHTFEREAITTWLRTHSTSPLTGLRLAHTGLTDNHSLRGLILEWRGL